MSISSGGSTDRSEVSLEDVLYHVKRVIVGQDALLERMVVALVARGHLLVEGVPGLAKTLAVKTFADALGVEFQRIQFTPDLVPADIVGTRIYNQKHGEFEVSLGPIFANLVLADEINRAPAKVQSALARSDAGAPGHHRPRDLPAARPVLGHGDPKPDRVRRDLSPSRGAGRPVHAQGARRLPERHRGVRHRRADDRRPREGAAR